MTLLALLTVLLALLALLAPQPLTLEPSSRSDQAAQAAGCMLRDLLHIKRDYVKPQANNSPSAVLVGCLTCSKMMKGPA